MRKISRSERLGNFKDNFFLNGIIGYVYWIQFFISFFSMSAFDEGYRETWYRNADKALLILNYRVIVRLRRIHDGTYFFFFHERSNDSIVEMID